MSADLTGFLNGLTYFGDRNRIAHLRVTRSVQGDVVSQLRCVCQVRAETMPAWIDAGEPGEDMPDTRRVVAFTNGLTGPQQAILDTVLMLGVRGIAATRDTVARWLGIHPNGGSYGTNLGFLRSNGYLEGFSLTEQGRAAARPTATGPDAALAAMPDEPKRKIVRALVAAGQPLTRDQLAEAIGVHPNGGSYGTNLGYLRTMGVITAKGPIAPTEGYRR